MALVPAKKLIDVAYAEHYAVPHFNCLTFEEIKGVILAAADERAPFMIAVYHEFLDHLGADLLATITRELIEKHHVEGALHLDHSLDLARVSECIEAGFTSVMIDASKEPLRTNIDLTRQAVALAAPRGVSVEAELGMLGTLADKGGATIEDFLTDPAEAVQLVNETGVDCLAVAFGTGHGASVKTENLHFERLSEIRDAVSVPLVMHGGSGVPTAAVQKAIRLGVAKINIGTRIFTSYVGEVTRHAQAEKGISILNMTDDIVQAVRATAVEKIREFGASGKSTSTQTKEAAHV